VLEIVSRPEACVVAPGGGWAAQPGNIADVSERALTVHLFVSPEEAAERTAHSFHRPLLDGKEPEDAIRELWAVRKSFYETSELEVDTTARTADDVAREVAALARTHGGW
jgi:shikimate kinase